MVASTNSASFHPSELYAASAQSFHWAKVIGVAACGAGREGGGWAGREKLVAERNLMRNWMRAGREMLDDVDEGREMLDEGRQRDA